MNEEYREFLEAGEAAGGRYVLSLPDAALRGTGGVQLGQRSGSSLDFKDYREYQPGDDLRHIDWNVFARSDKLILKLYREEVCPHVDIILDGSRSMALPDSRKVRAVLGLAAIFAAAAGNANCTHHAWLAADGVRRVQAGAGAPGLWEGIDFEWRDTPAASVRYRPGRWRRRGIRVLLSDLLWAGAPLDLLRVLADGAAAVHVIQVLARADVEPPALGNTRLTDVESDGTLDVFVDASSQTRYREALADHQQHWHRACRQVGASIASVVAEDLLDGWRLDPLEEQQILLASGA